MLTSTWPLTQPSLALSQESCCRPCAPAGGFICPGPSAVPRELIVLTHSSYHLIFQCALSVVSDLHICWNTIGCSLCSSDQLGVSLVPRGSGLCSHLLPPSSDHETHNVFKNTLGILYVMGVMKVESVLDNLMYNKYSTIIWPAVVLYFGGINS